MNEHSTINPIITQGFAMGAWHKSSHSSDFGGSCLEARATTPGSADSTHVALRDSQHRHHGHLLFPGREWAAFIQAAQRGDL